MAHSGKRNLGSNLLLCPKACPEDFAGIHENVRGLAVRCLFVRGLFGGHGGNPARPPLVLGCQIFSANIPGAQDNHRLYDRLRNSTDAPKDPVVFFC